MGVISEVLIQFKDSDGRNRRARILQPEGMPVQAVFLGGAENDFVITRKGEPQAVTPEKTTVPPEGVTLVPEDGLREGPGPVCYLVNGRLKCWNPT